MFFVPYSGLLGSEEIYQPIANDIFGGYCGLLRYYVTVDYKGRPLSRYLHCGLPKKFSTLPPENLIDISILNCESPHSLLTSNIKNESYYIIFFKRILYINMQCALHSKKAKPTVKRM